MSARHPALCPPSFASERWKCGIRVAVVIALVGFGCQRSSEAVGGEQGALRASMARLTFVQDDGRSLAKVGRRQEPELWYRVIFVEAPLGVPQRLRCEWTDPAGHVVRENRYQTKSITHLPWETHARLRLRAGAPLGQWHATLYRSAERLFTLSFEVVDE